MLLAGATEFIFNSNALATPGDLYASDLATNSIVVYAIDGTKRTFATGLNSPQGLAFDPTGNLYVADAGSGNIYKFARGGGRTTFASGVINPNDLAIDGPDLLVAENGGNVVSSFPLTGGSKTIPFRVLLLRWGSVSTESTVMLRIRVRVQSSPGRDEDRYRSR